MVRVGEETGTLDTQIDSAATFYSRELEFKLKRLTDLFEPAVILFMGFIVGFVAVALISAMYGIFSSGDLDETRPAADRRRRSAARVAEAIVLLGRQRPRRVRRPRHLSREA